ncbi:hypothetical protein ENBRE01_2162 [Enteropsectra breve]|nr:hypothetical protein ENBRE01_2162 [Enteropsectra breve]
MLNKQKKLSKILFCLILGLACYTSEVSSGKTLVPNDPSYTYGNCESAIKFLLAASNIGELIEANSKPIHRLIHEVVQSYKTESSSEKLALLYEQIIQAVVERPSEKNLLVVLLSKALDGERSDKNKLFEIKCRVGLKNLITGETLENTLLYTSIVYNWPFSGIGENFDKCALIDYNVNANVLMKKTMTNLRAILQKDCCIFKDTILPKNIIFNPVFYQGEAIARNAFEPCFVYTSRDSTTEVKYVLKAVLYQESGGIFSGECKQKVLVFKEPAERQAKMKMLCGLSANAVQFLMYEQER